MVKCTRCKRKIGKGKEAYDKCKPYCNTCFNKSHKWGIDEAIRKAKMKEFGYL